MVAPNRFCRLGSLVARHTTCVGVCNSIVKRSNLDVFRYADPPADGEQWIDSHQLKAVMDRLVAAFDKQITGRGIGR